MNREQKLPRRWNLSEIEVRYKADAAELKTYILNDSVVSRSDRFNIIALYFSKLIIRYQTNHSRAQRQKKTVLLSHWIGIFFSLLSIWTVKKVEQNENKQMSFYRSNYIYI